MPTDCTAKNQALCAADAPRLNNPQRRAFWRQPAVRNALLEIAAQGPDTHSCAISHVSRICPDREQWSDIAVLLAPDVPVWWLGPADARVVIANALQARSKRFVRSPGSTDRHIIASYMPQAEAMPAH
jgi:hypothetical protein